MVGATDAGDEIHLFHRQKHRGDFVYIGRLKLVSYTQESQSPSRFTFETC